MLRNCIITDRLIQCLPLNSFIVRNYAESDFSPWVKFSLRFFTLGPSDVRSYSDYLFHKFRRPGYNAQKDFFVAEQEGRIVGYADMIFEKRISRAVFDGYVAPGFRRRGIGRALLSRLLFRSRERGAETAHVNLRDSAQDSRFFLFDAGFIPVRTFYDMQLDLEKSSAAAQEAPECEVGKFVKGEEKILARLQNRVFKGSWGFCPNSAAEIRYSLCLTGCRLEDVLCLKKEGITIGYSWYHHLPLERDGAAMRIHMFGVDPDFRGKGWGKKILIASLYRMRRKKIKKVELTVDADNTPALALYGSLGFQLKCSSRWYEKKYQGLKIRRLE